jgi:hypothetical protein
MTQSGLLFVADHGKVCNVAGSREHDWTVSRKYKGLFISPTKLYRSLVIQEILASDQLSPFVTTGLTPQLAKLQYLIFSTNRYT